MKTGAPTGTVYTSKAARRRYGRAMRAEEERWRSLNGPVTVTRIMPDEDAETRAARNAFLAADRQECDESHQDQWSGPEPLARRPQAGQDEGCHETRATLPCIGPVSHSPYWSAHERPAQSSGQTQVRAGAPAWPAIGPAEECSAERSRAHRRQGVAPAEGRAWETCTLGGAVGDQAAVPRAGRAERTPRGRLP